MIDAKEIGWTIRVLRAHRKQQDVARAAGLTSSVLSNIETGRTKNPTLDTLRAIAEALGEPLERLLKKTPANPVKGGGRESTTH